MVTSFIFATAMRDYANTISDAKLATEKYLGSKIKRQLEMFGLRDFTIRFYITGSH